MSDEHSKADELHFVGMTTDNHEGVRLLLPDAKLWPAFKAQRESRGEKDA